MRVSADNPAGIENFQDPTEAQLVLTEDGVSIAEYAKDVLANANSEYGGNFEQRVLDKMVSREADATFVYTTDVTEDIRDRVRVIEMPENVTMRGGACRRGTASRR